MMNKIILVYSQKSESELILSQNFAITDGKILWRKKKQASIKLFWVLIALGLLINLKRTSELKFRTQWGTTFYRKVDWRISRKKDVHVTTARDTHVQTRTNTNEETVTSCCFLKNFRNTCHVSTPCYKKTLFLKKEWFSPSPGTDFRRLYL